MNLFKRLFYIILNMAILGLIVLSIFKIKGAFLDRSADVGKKINSAKEAVLAKEISKAREGVVKNFPEPEGAVSKTFQWQYKGKNYSISQNLFYSIYGFYKSQPKTYAYFNELPADWEEEYYGMFIVKSEKYDFAKEFLEAIVSQGQKNKLSDDQMVELVLAFVQAIPYDDQKASNILSRAGGETMNYPYETLFENKGVCSDKSFLAVSLLRELGYGTAIFVYDNENHMAIGIQCPLQYSNYQSGYCYAETTSVGNKIGIIPELKAYAGKAVGSEELSYFGENGFGASQTTRLGEAKIFQKTQAREYGGIAQTVKTNNEIVMLKKEISALSSRLERFKSDLGRMVEDLELKKKKLEQYLKSNDIDTYNGKAQEYNREVKNYEGMVKDYNRLVKEYNEKVARYNYLIKL